MVTILNNAHIANHTGCDVLQHCPVMIGCKGTPKVETTHVDVHIAHLKTKMVVAWLLLRVNCPCDDGIPRKDIKG